MGWHLLRVWVVAGCHWCPSGSRVLFSAIWSNTNKSRLCHSLNEKILRHSPGVPTERKPQAQQSLQLLGCVLLLLHLGLSRCAIFGAAGYPTILSLTRGPITKSPFGPSRFFEPLLPTRLTYILREIFRACSPELTTHIQPLQTPPQTCRVGTNAIGF